VNGIPSASSFSCSADRQDRRPGLPVCHWSGRTQAAFRKTVRSRKRAYSPINTPFPAKPRTTTLGPFGEVIRATGPLAKTNPFRFSTKYQDDESDLLCYGDRYYKPSTGTWINRDPGKGSVPHKCIIELHTPTIAPMVPMKIRRWNGFSATNVNGSVPHNRILDVFSVGFAQQVGQRTCRAHV